MKARGKLIAPKCIKDSLGHKYGQCIEGDEVTIELEEGYKLIRCCIACNEEIDEHKPEQVRTGLCERCLGDSQ